MAEERTVLPRFFRNSLSFSGRKDVGRWRDAEHGAGGGSRTRRTEAGAEDSRGGERYRDVGKRAVHGAEKDRPGQNLVGAPEPAGLSPACGPVVQRKFDKEILSKTSKVGLYSFPVDESLGMNRARTQRARNESLLG
ncbi:hypothetical protein MTO96_001448 [Rhipicephalus appendiculatus]